jgi:IS5 family transposase
MVALHDLKYQHDQSDEAAVAHGMENPYWQHFSGGRYFQHRLPLDASSMTRWRQRLGEAGAEQMLGETIVAGIKMGAMGAADLKRINVDTTVETKAGVPSDRSWSLGWKAIRYPTGARLYHRCRVRLVRAARREGLAIQQSYRHVGNRLLLASSRYAHARQRKRPRAATRRLRTQLGRVTREIERQAAQPSEKLAPLLETAHRIHAQQRHD